MMLDNEQILVEAKNVAQHFPVKQARGRKAMLQAVAGVSLKIKKGEAFGLVGESGCGKSTLGKAILRLFPLSGGQIKFAGQDIAHLKGRQLKSFRCQAQMIFQDPSSCLNPRRKIKDILNEPFAIHKLYQAQERQKRIAQLCDMVGLSTVYLERYPHEMSGGQKQRVGIARALALDPQLLICDEPVSALDVSIQAQVINLLEDLQKQLGLTYLFISHNLSVVKHFCQNIAVMYLGRIVEQARADQLYANSLHPYTQALISAIPQIGLDRPAEIVLSGDMPSPTAPPPGCAFNTRCPYVMERCLKTRPQLLEVAPDHFVACFLYDQAWEQKDSVSYKEENYQ